MIIQNEQDIQALLAIGAIVAEARDAMAALVAPGITTQSLDDVCAELLKKHGALSAPMSLYDFPGVSCISVNEVACHGVPDEYVLKEGDLVNIDVSASKDGYFADTGVTLAVGRANPLQEDMIRVSKEALAAGIAAARPGTTTANIGKAIYKVARQNNYTVIRNLTGHGVGKSLHEEPHYIFNYQERRESTLLKEGNVVAIETFISNGDEWVEDNPEGVWPMRTLNQSQVVQFEHTVILRKEGNLITTASKGNPSQDTGKE
ncbi:Methionine aminopeptidase [Clostridiaceae bacterium JG1575]|nr:Methionine aminopeptidase [Clostridiaceae bacterium JG1575]